MRLIIAIFLLLPVFQKERVYKVTYVRTDHKAQEKVENLPFANKEAVVDLFEEREYTLYAGKRANLYQGAGSYQIYYDKEKNLFLKKTVLPDGRSVLVKYDSISFKWHIDKKPEKLGRYTVYKATTTYKGKPVTGWFTPEIPVDGGPELFHGLPGLILVLKWKDYTYKATKIEETNKEIQPPSAPEEITAKEYEQILGKYGFNFGSDNIKVIIINK